MSVLIANEVDNLIDRPYDKKSGEDNASFVIGDKQTKLTHQGKFTRNKILEVTK